MQSFLARRRPQVQIMFHNFVKAHQLLSSSNALHTAASSTSWAARLARVSRSAYPTARKRSSREAVCNIIIHRHIDPEIRRWACRAACSRKLQPMPAAMRNAVLTSFLNPSDLLPPSTILGRTPASCRTVSHTDLSV